MDDGYTSLILKATGILGPSEQPRRSENVSRSISTPDLSQRPMFESTRGCTSPTLASLFRPREAAAHHQRLLSPVLVRPPPTNANAASYIVSPSPTSSSGASCSPILARLSPTTAAFSLLSSRGRCSIKLSPHPASPLPSPTTAAFSLLSS